MDVRCLHCGEPWDIDHLVHGVSEDNIQTEGWEFGVSRAAVKRCPCCTATNQRPDQDRAFVEAALLDLYADDLDATAVAIADLEGGL